MNSTPERTDPTRGTRQPPGTRGGILGWFTAHPKTTLALSLLLMLGLAAWLLDAAAEKRLQRRLDAIRATGAPVSVEDLNAAMPDIPDEENMALLLLEHAEPILAFKLSEEQDKLLPWVGQARMGSTGRRLPPEQSEAARLYLAGFQHELQGIHRAMAFERGCYPIEWSTPALRVYMPELLQFRQIAKVLCLEATIAAEDGEADRAARILLDLSHAHRALDCNASVITSLVRIAINAQAAALVEHSLNLCGLSDASIRRLQASFEQCENRVRFKEAMMAERVMFIDMLQWVRSGKGGDPGTLIAGGPSPVWSIWRHVPVLAALDTDLGLGIQNAMVDAIDQPDAASIKRLKAAEASGAGLPTYSILSRVLIPSLSRAAELWVRAVGQNRALRAALACERYRLATGDWPVTLDVLVPEYLEAVPSDPFDGKPIRYAHIEEGIKLWSIGEDMTDDGGDVKRLRRKRNEKPTDYGWVLLNPDLRGRPAEEPED